MLSEANILELITNESCSLVLDKLVEQAKAAGGLDNITVILAKNED
jgi:serine/threonine protein phosphatase PrpC